MVAPFEKYPEYIVQDEKIRTLINKHYVMQGFPLWKLSD